MKKWIAICLVFSLMACEKTLFEEVPDTERETVFEQVWDFTNKNYSFFEFKGIDWDSVGYVYRARVRASSSDDSLFQICGEMLATLRDGHVNLSGYDDISRYWGWYLNYPPNYNKDVLQRNYFQDEEQYMGPFTVMDFEDVGYFRYSSFSSSFGDNTVEKIIDKFSQHKGIILDLRNNGGGLVSNVYDLAKFFTTEEKVVGYRRAKNGPGRNDFGDYSSLTVKPNEGRVYTKPVVLLTNRSCYSATNLFRTVMEAFDQVHVIGDATGGGGGVPTQTELSNGWILRVSSTQSFDLNWNNTEHGVAPDQWVDITDADVAAGIDPILEAALNYLRQ